MSSIVTRETKGQGKPLPLTFFMNVAHHGDVSVISSIGKGQLIWENLKNQTQRKYLVFFGGSAFTKNLPAKTRETCNSVFVPHLELPLPNVLFHCCLLWLFWTHRGSSRDRATSGLTATPVSIRSTLGAGMSHSTTQKPFELPEC